MLAIREELANKDEAGRRERVQRETALQDVTMQLNSLESDHARLQAQILSVGHDKQTLEDHLRESFQVQCTSLQLLDIRAPRACIAGDITYI